MFNVEVFLSALPVLADAAKVTVQLTVAACSISLVAGLFSVWLQLGGGTLGNVLSRTYVSLMRGTPLYVQLLVIFFGLPMLGLRNQAFLAAALAIGLNSGAYTTEIFRGAVLAVSPGHIDAARTVGLTRFTIWRRVVFPQALITSLPMLAAEFSIVLKSTPLASVIAVTEMTYAGVLIQARTFTAAEVFLPLALGYIVLAQCILRVSHALENRFLHLRF